MVDCIKYIAFESQDTSVRWQKALQTLEGKPGCSWNWDAINTIQDLAQNTLSGAMCDLEVPLFQYGFKHFTRDWKWRNRYPSADEIQKYLYYVDSKMSLRKDIIFSKKVIRAEFEDKVPRQRVILNTGDVHYCRFSVLCEGFGAFELSPFPIYRLRDSLALQLYL